MREVGKQFYLEESFDGVVLGAVKLDHGLLLVDSPLRFSDQVAWREKTALLGAGIDQITLMLDTHIDRTIGLRALGGSVLGHESAAAILEKRPASLRPQEIEPGSEAEALDPPINARWASPDMTFSHTAEFYTSFTPLMITHRPGCHLAACWVRSDAEKLIFVGDSVLENQPPFLAWSDIDIWLKELAQLQSETLREYRIVSSRNGVVHRKAIEDLSDFLSFIKETLPELASQEDRAKAVTDLLPELLRKFSFDKKLTGFYRKRLAYGLTEYLQRQAALKKSKE